jgi:RNA polymerase sigma-70 factor (ECF subfamily)
MRIVHQRADAEAVLMATFLQAWRSAAAFDAARGSVLGWLTTIARSRAIDQSRATARRARHEPLGDDEDAASTAELSHVEPDPIAAIETDEQRRSINAALATLQPAQRHAIELAFFEGLTHVEVAERLAEPLGTIKTRIRLGMIKLRELLAPLAKESRA